MNQFYEFLDQFCAVKRDTVFSVATINVYLIIMKMNFKIQAVQLLGEASASRTLS